MPDILLRGGRVIDPARDFDAQAEVLLKDGKIASIERGLAAPGAKIIDVKDCWVVPKTLATWLRSSEVSGLSLWTMT